MTALPEFSQFIAGSQTPQALRFTVRGALTMALLIGGAQNSAFAHQTSPQAAIQVELARGHADKAVELGEAAVIKAPQDAALRAELGHAYMRAGRFESAVSVLGDALALGDGSQRTTLGLALAQIAAGQNRAALATLDRGGATIAPAELGLALALAGDPERGIGVMTDSVREGSASAKLRQNLAYAYALDGRWTDARLIAGFDLAPEQVESRLQQWAQSMQFGGERVRIARLLNVPVTIDQGMPTALALNRAQAAPSLATAKADAARETLAVAAPQAVAVIPVTAPVVAVVEPVAPVPIVAAPVEPYRLAVAWSAPVNRRHIAFAAAWQPARHLAVHPYGAIKNYNHFLQLGAFSSARGAERAKLILAKYNPRLRGNGLLITQANVKGRMFWRVATSGFDSGTAAFTCASLKHHGEACFAYTVRHASHGEAWAFGSPGGASFRAERR